MGRAPCCDKANVKRGPWSPEEDTTLKNYLESHGTGGNWIALPQKAGLKRCGKSCRLRWLNYLRPDIKHGGFTEEEDNIICTLYKSIGSRWSVIASQLSGRTDNDVKNYWNTKLKKKLMAGQTDKLTANNINITSNNHIHHSPSPSPPIPVIPTTVKAENYGYGSFQMSADDNSPAPTLTSVDAGIGFSLVPHRLVPEPTSFPVVPALIEPSDLGGESVNGYVVSPPQAISAASSSLTMENSNGYVSWSGNGGSGDDAFFMELGFGPLDFLSGGGGGYGIQDKIGEVAPNYSQNPACIGNLWAKVEGKPQELYQSVTYS